MSKEIKAKIDEYLSAWLLDAKKSVKRELLKLRLSSPDSVITKQVQVASGKSELSEAGALESSDFPFLRSGSLWQRSREALHREPYRSLRCPRLKCLLKNIPLSSYCLQNSENMSMFL